MEWVYANNAESLSRVYHGDARGGDVAGFLRFWRHLFTRAHNHYALHSYVHVIRTMQASLCVPRRLDAVIYYKHLWIIKTMQHNVHASANRA